MLSQNRFCVSQPNRHPPGFHISTAASTSTLYAHAATLATLAKISVMLTFSIIYCLLPTTTVATNIALPERSAAPCRFLAFSRFMVLILQRHITCFDDVLSLFDTFSAKNDIFTWPLNSIKALDLFRGSASKS
jgi:hypothetical protein